MEIILLQSYKDYGSLLSAIKAWLESHLICVTKITPKLLDFNVYQQIHFIIKIFSDQKLSHVIKFLLTLHNLIIGGALSWFRSNFLS